MSRSLVWFALLVGCGDDGAETIVDVPDVPDAVDAPIYDFSCLDDPFGTTAPEPTLVVGKIVNIDSTQALSGIAVGVHDATDDAVLATAVTAGNGTYQTSVATGGAALEIYRRLTATNMVTTRAFTFGPLTGSSNLENVVLTSAELASVETAFGLSHDPLTGIVATVIRDCSNTPVAGARVTISPTPSRLGYFGDDGQPAPAATSTGADGNALAWGLAPGAVAVTVTIGNVAFRARPVSVEADGLTLSFRQP